MTNLCALYNVHLGGDHLRITYNDALSMGTAYALETQLISNGYSGTSGIYSNNGSGLVSCDDDSDGITNAEDNCPDIPNSPELGSCYNYYTQEVWGACTEDCGPEWYIWCANSQGDGDNDGIGYVCDNCPYNCNTQQLDADSDGIGDVCDTEDDGCFSCGNGPICETEC